MSSVPCRCQPRGHRRCRTKTYSSFASNGVIPMPLRLWPVLLGLLLLSGCNGNYKFDDSRYRPLGDPQVINRDQ